MTEPEWLASEDPSTMLGYLAEIVRSGHGWSATRTQPRMPSDRKLRLFACACFRQVWQVLTDERSYRAVEVAERYADGLATDAELSGSPRNWGPCERTGLRAAELVITSHVCAMPVQSTLMRDIVGNPWRPVVLDATLLTPTVVSLATAAYEERAGKVCPCQKGDYPGHVWTGQMPALWKECPACQGAGRIADGSGLLDALSLAALADALEEAGCPPEEEVPCPTCSRYAGQPCPMCDGERGAYRRTGEMPTEHWRDCSACRGKGKFPPGYRPERDPASGRHEGGWTNCKTCNGGRGQVRPGVVLVAHPLLAHLRSPGPHVRGCWVVDAVLGRE